MNKNKSTLFYTPYTPSWLKWLTPEIFYDEKLFRIVIFYVFHNPCAGLSVMSKSLSDYNWSNPFGKPFYLNKHLKDVSNSEKLVFPADNYENILEQLEKADLKDNFPSNLSRERIVMHDNKDNHYMSIFYHIRNSLAHGRINIVDVDGECIFILEDVNERRKNNKGEVAVSARMIIKRDTLLKWIDIIEMGEKEYKKKVKN